MIGILLPVHNEEKLLGACLESLLLASRHPGLNGEPVTILVVLDSCTDHSANIALEHGVITLALKARNVGQARAAGARYLLAHGARWLASTDGDSNVAADWLVEQLALDADAVCGTITLAMQNNGLSATAQTLFEQHYQHREGHRHIHGANLGVSASAYLRAGGFPFLTCHEDVHLVRQLERSGARIAWSCRPQVTTSTRLDPRASGGFGDYLRLLSEGSSESGH
ncbi:glycosyl transferase [Pseudomonas cichorii]|uniref:glycosyltransferase n=1 Tax=Pseudomonas cichorii TaxID=36746 RepID=UPI00190FC687|nr:glycosyltransferase [Pseudomonas cichorii]GFM81264.1 glycosyl transferase [Pseudomonas cichorii]